MLEEFDTERSNRRNAFARSMILSASGWRAVFGDGDHGLAESICLEARDAVVVAATLFAEALTSAGETICVGTDTRPTGAVIAETAIRSILAAGREVAFLGRVASPELMAFVKNSPEIDAFFYVTASHNPPGHNGFKLGGSDGAVISRDRALPLIERFIKVIADDDSVHPVVAEADAVQRSRLDAVYRRQISLKAAAEARYREFALSVASGHDDDEANQRFVDDLRSHYLNAPLGIVAELNGSARALSVDRSLLTELGVRLSVHNDKPGVFAHEIVPEGASLAPAAAILEECARFDTAFKLAYVPDNDGDRGNLVFLNSDGAATVLEAQEVFALALTAELAWTRRRGQKRPVAVAINGPTSIRIDRIARAFDAEVFRAEVGEANVVNLAAELRERGYLVPICGEGSNGGTIVHPATVRDPLNTLLTVLKFLRHQLYREWSAVSGGGTVWAQEPSLVDVVNSLPAFSTTNANDGDAKMKVRTSDQGRLKGRYEAILPERVGTALAILEPHFGKLAWRETNLEGTQERVGSGPGVRSGAERGGLRVVFSAAGRDCAAVWMRGSGTEPLFRILADVEGARPEVERALLDWQRSLVLEADVG